MAGPTSSLAPLLGGIHGKKKWNGIQASSRINQEVREGPPIFRAGILDCQPETQCISVPALSLGFDLHHMRIFLDPKGRGTCTLLHQQKILVVTFTNILPLNLCVHSSAQDLNREELMCCCRICPLWGLNIKTSPESLKRQIRPLSTKRNPGEKWCLEGHKSNLTLVTLGSATGCLGDKE